MAGFSRRPSNALIAEILAIRCQFATERVLISLCRFYELATKAGYDPSQPRLPRGMAGGGRWTDGGAAPGGSFGSGASGGRERLAQARTGRGPRTPVQTSRGLLEATPRQEVEVVIAAMQANRAIGLVRRVDPNWSPRPSFHSTIEGEIAYQRGIPREGDAYLNSILRPFGQPAAPPRRIGDNGGPAMVREPGPSSPSPYSILVPNGRVIGYRAKGAGEAVRTLSPTEFDATVLRLTEDRISIAPQNSYRGIYYYYDLPDRCVIGFRMSDDSGLTFDIIESGDNLRMPRRTKFHRGNR